MLNVRSRPDNNPTKMHRRLTLRVNYVLSDTVDSLPNHLFFNYVLARYYAISLFW
jgi:hypothetical protein